MRTNENRLHRENRPNEVEISGSPWYTGLNGLRQVLPFIPQTYFADDYKIRYVIILVMTRSL